MIPQEWLQYAPKPHPLTDVNQWNVFLSYRSVNRTWVLNLYDILNGLEHKVFIDQCELAAGDELIYRLEQALHGSQAGILIWSVSTEDSAWVRKEYNTLERRATKNADFKFIPIRLDNSELPDFAANRIFLDFSSYPDGPNGGELLRLLHAIAGKPLSSEAARFANEQDEKAKKAFFKIDAAINNKRAEKLIELFNENDLPWKTTAALGCKAAEGLTRLKYNKEAIEMLEKLVQQFPKAIRPKQLYALALARRNEPGDLDNAQDVLGELYAQGERDPETLGIYGRTWMDRYATSKDINDLERSRNYYSEAFEKAPDDYYTGINAAAKSVFLGTPEDMERAKEYSQKVQKITGTTECQGDYWKTATIAELFLIEKKYQEAGAMYKKAVNMARSETGSHESTWKQAVRLMQKLQPEENERKLVLEPFKHLPEYDKTEVNV